MSTKITLSEALRRLRLNTMALKSEDYTRFIASLHRHIAPRGELSSSSEKVIESHIRDFLKDAFYDNGYYVGKKDETNTDLCIFSGNSEKGTAEVLIECKNPKADNHEMIDDDHLNRKALHEVITYYMEELSRGNYDVKYLVVTNGYDWFIFEALTIRELIATNALLTKYKAIKAPSLSSAKMASFYTEEVKPCIEKALDRLVYTYFSIEKSDKSADLKNICKAVSPYFMLKQSREDKFALNERFYNELLYIIGMEETKKDGIPIITRRKTGDREPASLLENTLHQLSDFPAYQSRTPEGQLDLALELVLMWVNRLLFIKLVESQLVSFNADNDSYRFFSTKNIKDYNDLNELFFQVLAITEDNRHSISQCFSVVPYLNSRLFELSQIEIDFFRISSLKVDKMHYYESTVLVDDARQSKNVDNIRYIVDFLNHYDFGADNKEKLGFAREEKELINASVLGKIFEKINGYKDGAVFTPSGVTQFISREALERTVIDKFSESGWQCETISDIKEQITKANRHEANNIVDSIRVCDPAVGSGHFLVSVLNRIIEIKWRLGILLDEEGLPVNDYTIAIVDDELVVRDGEGNRFAYKRKDVSTHRVQKTLFCEKRNIIENCLFGVDINPNSINICQLRLWIELLKNAYYKEDGKLETLPNIDINIKMGDSLIHQKSLDDDLRSEMIKARMTIAEYKQIVGDYKNLHDKQERKKIEVRLNNLKEKIIYISKNQDPLYRKRNQEQAKWYDMSNSLFANEEDEKIKTRFEKQTSIVDKLNLQIEERESLYGKALEWRFAFPEVLDDNGRFVGFDCIVGNPPYIAIAKLKDEERKALVRMDYRSFNKMGDISMIFYEFCMSLLKPQGLLMFITTNTWLRADSGMATREFMASHSNPLMLVDFKSTQLFSRNTVATNILLARKSENTSSTMACEVVGYDKKSDLAKFVSNRLIENSFVDSNPWVVLTDTDMAIINKVNHASVNAETGKVTTIGSMGYEIYCGIKTGLNEAFVISDSKELDRLVKKDERTKELLKQAVRGEDLTRFKFLGNVWLLNVHNGLKEENLPPIDINDYPAVKQRLDDERLHTKLVRREDQGDTPYNLRNCAYLREFEKPKIMWGELSDKPKFVLDDEGQYYCLNTVFFFTGKHLEYLLCYLNSPICEYVFSKQCTTSGTGTMRWLKYTVERIAIPQISAEQELAISELYHKYKETGHEEIIGEINSLLYDYIGISSQERATIEAIRSQFTSDLVVNNHISPFFNDKGK